MTNFNLKSCGITVKDIRRNLGAAKLYAAAIREEPDCVIADSGALISYSGKKTGRSPSDKHVVKSPATEHDVWWGPVNVPIDISTFQINLERAKDYLKFLSDQVGVKIAMVSTGPERDQVIWLDHSIVQAG